MDGHISFIHHRPQNAVRGVWHLQVAFYALRANFCHNSESYRTKATRNQYVILCGRSLAHERTIQIRLLEVQNYNGQMDRGAKDGFDSTDLRSPYCSRSYSISSKELPDIHVQHTQYIVMQLVGQLEDLTRNKFYKEIFYAICTNKTVLRYTDQRLFGKRIPHRLVAILLTEVTN